MNKLQKQNKQLRTLAAVLALMFLGAVAVICGQAFNLNACRSEVVIIDDQVNNDLHDVKVSFRDTIVMTGIDEAHYRQLMDNHIMPVISYVK